jgi:hypothetical protein
MITILSFIGSKKRLILFITISLSGILLISTSNIFFADIFYSLSSKFDPDSEIYYKLKDFAVFIKNPEFDTSTGAGGRAERYPLLFKALAANPLLGDASYDSRLKIYRGVHLYWMNRLALWGIPGFLIFVFVLFKIFRSISSLFDADYRFYYFLSVTAFIFLGLTKAVGGREPWLMLIVVIPGLYFLPLLQQAKKTSDSKG